MEKATSVDKKRKVALIGAPELMLASKGTAWNLQAAGREATSMA